MNRTRLLLFGVLALAASAATASVAFSDIPQWEPTEFYHRGEVVRHDFDMYISIVPSKGEVPSVQSTRWLRIDYNDRLAFRAKTLFPIGTVVTHEERYYIARGMNVAVSSEHLLDERRWLAFTHPGLIYDLPPRPTDPEAVQNLVGVDANRNGIRDDYELAILFSDLPEPIKRAALAAGRAYGALMQAAVNETAIEEAVALEILHHLVLAHQCRRRMRELHEGRAWQESDYFDTLDRIEAKYKIQHMLGQIVDAAGYTLPREQEPCVALASI